MARSYTTGSMAKGSAARRRGLVRRIREELVLGGAVAPGIDQEAHAPAGHAPQHPEAPVGLPRAWRAPSIRVSV